MEASQLQRYSRQIRLAEIGECGQQRLIDARVLVIGAGGLGSAALMYLAAAGAGHLVVSDFDRVDESNLQRQIVHGHADIGKAKATSAHAALLALNPGLRVDAIDYELDGGELEEQVASADVLLDCTDNFASRYVLNRACWETGTPMVSGAAARWHGQASCFVPARAGSPCFQCLYPDAAVEAATCAADGIMAPVVGIIGAVQALEALKILIGAGSDLCGRLLLLDGLTMACDVVKLEKNSACPVCARQSVARAVGEG